MKRRSAEIPGKTVEAHARSHVSTEVMLGSKCTRAAKLRYYIAGATFPSGVVVLLLCLCTSCDRMITPHGTQVVKDADAKAASGDYLQAIQLYESALEDPKGAAEIHYRLGLLYDDKMNEPLNALHHFKRYLTLAPAGSHANEVKNFMKRDELALITNLSGDAVVTHAEATRLRNENLSLHKQIEDQHLRERNIPGDKTGRGAAKPGSVANKTGGRAYVVQAGDTLASISRKFYKTRTRWKRILNANQDSIDNPEKLKVGQTLTIP